MLPGRAARIGLLLLVTLLVCRGGAPPLASALETTVASAAKIPTDLDASARIAEALSRPDAAILGEPLRERLALTRFYAARADQPAWPPDSRAARSLSEAIRAAATHGLRPSDYHAKTLDEIEAASSSSTGIADPLWMAQRDLLLSDAFLHLARALSRGQVDPRSLHPSYSRGDTPPDLVEALETLLAETDAAEVFAALAPSHPEYADLRKALAGLRATPSEPVCPGLPSGPIVRPGERSRRIAQLRACLLGPRTDASSPDFDPTRLDPALVRALREIQRAQALSVDGILGPETTAALVATHAQRIDRIRANLERWRWQPRTFGRRFIRVDIPRYRLRTLEGERLVLEMRAVVGRSSWSTPIVHSAINELVLNPSWYVPRSIFVKEMLPLARRNPGYLDAEGLVVSEIRDGQRARVDAASVDWAAIDPEQVAYQVRQPPGPRNPLGLIKFPFPNEYGVHLHGTPGRAALARAVRIASHGCVRVEDEIALALFALAPDPEWTQERIVSALATKREQSVVLPEPLPVHLLYFTAEVDAEGVLSIALDPYDWDARLIAALGPEDD